MRGGFENGLLTVACRDSPNSTSISAFGPALEFAIFADPEDSRLAVVVELCSP